MKKIAIIGGGIFGVSAALELSDVFEVSLFEKKSKLLGGATYANHNRHHAGFHYPRSIETVQQIQKSQSSFEEVYGAAVFKGFSNYYCVSKSDSFSDPDSYISFCQKMGLEFEKVEVPSFIDQDKISLCLKVNEGVYNFSTLNDLVQKRLFLKPEIKIHLNSQVVMGSINTDGKKNLHIQEGECRRLEEFDLVVDATYGKYNEFCSWFEFPKRTFQFNLQELCIIRLPIKERIGATIMDGMFGSFLPLASSEDLYLFAHAEESQLRREVSKNTNTLLNTSLCVESNWENVRSQSSRHLPILQDAEYIRSIFVDRVVEYRIHDDARVSEITAHGQGCWSIFSAKVITCISTARKLKQEMLESL